MVYLFLNVTKVTNLMTRDPIFSATVESLGGRVVEVIDPELRVHRLEVQGLMLDMHQYISATIKGLNQRRSGNLLEEGDENLCWHYMVEN